MRRILFLTAGLVCLGLAYVGAIAPGIPVTPWVLLASYCFARSSPRLQRWLLRAPLVGPFLRDWNQYRGIRRPIKLFALTTVVVVCGSSLIWAPLPDWVKIIIAVCATIGIGVILFVVPTIPSHAKTDRPTG